MRGMGGCDDGETVRRRMADSALDYDMLERRLLRIRGPEQSDRDKSEAWAQRQPWYARVVAKRLTARFWIWYLAPEGGR